MKHFLKSTVLCMAFIGAAAFITQSCGKDQSPGTAGAKDPSVTIANDGNDITFAPNAPQLAQFTVDTVRETSVRISVSAPVHTLVSVVASELNGKKLYLFETQDITDQYTSYLTAIANVQHSSLALRRTKDLYANDIAASKDLQDAQQDYATQQSNLADNVARLRAAGIDPKALEETPAGTVWAIADIPEGQVTAVKPGAKVALQYYAFPNDSFEGRVSSIGDVIDPNTRKVKVRIIVANPGGKLRPGMFGTAQFEEAPKKALAIPATGVVREGDGTMTVWVTTDRSHFTMRKVKIGMQDSDRYEILDGLHPGELAVTKGGIFLSNMLQAQSSD